MCADLWPVSTTQPPITLLPQISLALGFLFLGAGQQTFSTSNEAVAALVVALFPRFPQSPGDQRCHLQVLACYPLSPGAVRTWLHLCCAVRCR